MPTIDVSVKVNITNGDQIDSAQAVIRWISLNTDALVAYWEGQIDTAKLCEMLKPLPAQQTNALTSGPLRHDRSHQQRGSL